MHKADKKTYNYMTVWAIRTFRHLFFYSLKTIELCHQISSTTTSFLYFRQIVQLKFLTQTERRVSPVRNLDVICNFEV